MGETQPVTASRSTIGELPKLRKVVPIRFKPVPTVAIIEVWAEQPRAFQS
jgi:hypothetical protein